MKINDFPLGLLLCLIVSLIGKGISQDICQETFGNATETAQRFTSTNWPMSYPPLQFGYELCFIVITAAPESQIFIEFVEFNFAFPDILIAADLLVIDPSNSQSLFLSYPASPTFLSYSNNVLVNTWTLNSGPGFMARYQVFSEEMRRLAAPCGFDAVATNQPQKLFSYLWPNWYITFLDCTWAITAQPGEKIQLEFEFFQTEEFFDFLIVLEEDTFQEIYTGNLNSFLPTYNSDTSRVDLNFVTDFSENDRGFAIIYKILDAPPDICQSNIFIATDDQNYLKSPNYPLTYNNFTNATNCSAIIKAPQGKRILIVFESFDIPPPDGILIQNSETFSSGSGSGNLYLGTEKNEMIQDGSGSCKPVSEMECMKIFQNGFGSGNLPSFISKTNRVSFTFVTFENTEEASGFSAKFQVLTEEEETEIAKCGFNSNVKNTEQYLNSPNYPYWYENDENCTWNIEAPQGGRILLKFNSFNLEQCDPNCDYVQIFDNEIFVRLYTGDLGSNLPTYYSTSSKLRINFVSNNQINRPGFSATYKNYSGEPILPPLPTPNGPGTWSEWTNVQDCSVTCGRGEVKQKRVCDSAAANSSCKTNEQFQYIFCQFSDCPMWSKWSECCTTCGSGQQERFRECRNDEPACMNGTETQNRACIEPPSCASLKNQFSSCCDAMQVLSSLCEAELCRKACCEIENGEECSNN